MRELTMLRKRVRAIDVKFLPLERFRRLIEADLEHFRKLVKTGVMW